jgi:hypothetical protein
MNDYENPPPAVRHARLRTEGPSAELIQPMLSQRASVGVLDGKSITGDLMSKAW